MKKASLISYMFLSLFLGSMVLVTSCAPKPQAHCGTKKQKKQKYKAMKSGRAPGGGMLN